MTRIQRVGGVVLCVGMAGGLVAAAFMGAARGGSVAAVAQKTRLPDEILTEVSAEEEKLAVVMPALTLIGDAEFRNAEGAKALPALKRLSVLLLEFEEVVKKYDAIPDDERLGRSENARMNRYQLMAYRVALSDNEAVAKLDEVAKGKDADALSARVALLTGRWIASSGDAETQGKLLERFLPVVKEHAESSEVAGALALISNVGAANGERAKKAIGLIRENMKVEGQEKLLAGLEPIQFKREILDKPVVVEGQTNDRKRFSTASLKGKVVLVDFWATWCVPCLAEMPELKKLYAAYHEKGLEIVGVSSDYTADPLNKYVKEKEIPWVQLQEDFSQESAPLQPVAMRQKLAQLPAVFLIDRDGVMRFMEFRDASNGGQLHFRLGKHPGRSLEEQVKELLGK